MNAYEELCDFVAGDIEANGFSLEGSLKEAVMCEGNPTDYLCYGLVNKK